MFCSRKMNRKINHIHERALRLVYEDYTISFEDLLLRDESVSIHEMFKVKNGLCPRFISRLFCQTKTRTRAKASFHRPKVNTVYKGESPLRCFGPIVWDCMLPQNIKEISDLKDFKHKIKTWVPNNCVCRLCKVYVSNLGFVTLHA